jgi:hypothetical protein
LDPPRIDHLLDLHLPCTTRGELGQETARFFHLGQMGLG